ncbi:MAG TPA: hypothetical protein DCS85_11320, partial [Verrucomicrobiales bacterium]|nr:hypothetical protein [Verrucomicrobiales bacterium]
LPEIIARNTGPAILSTRRWRRGWQFGKIPAPGKGRNSDGHTLTGRIGWWWRWVSHTWCRRIELGRAYQRRRLIQFFRKNWDWNLLPTNECNAQQQQHGKQ